MVDLDMFVERVLLHNRIVTREQVDEAREIAQEYAGSNLIDGLINVGALDAAKARGIFEDFQRWAAKHGVVAPPNPFAPPVAAPAPAPAPAAAPAAAPAPTAAPAPAAAPSPTRSPARSAGGDDDDRDLLAVKRKDKTRRMAKKRHRVSLPEDSDSDDGHNSAELSQELTVRITAASVTQSADTKSAINQYLGYARRLDASDLHIKPDLPLAIRKHGQLLQFDLPPIPAAQTEQLLFAMLNEDQQQELLENRSIEFSYSVDGQGRYRVCLIRQRSGWEGTFRCLANRVPTFEDLGLPTSLQRLTDYHQGLVLVTGPSGSGKSTTLAAMVELVNQRRPVHIVTIEDPIEYAFRPASAQITQREVGLHTESYAQALRSALRQDPDVIMIGELRDLETISLAITAAETGHLVFGTLDTTSAPRTINRILEVFPPDEQPQIRRMVSESIRGIICQQLVMRRDGTGQALALEILFNTPGVGNLIREQKMTQIPALMVMGKSLGMVNLDDSLQVLVENGVIDGVEAYYASVDKSRFEQFAPVAI